MGLFGVMQNLQASYLKERELGWCEVKTPALKVCGGERREQEEPQRLFPEENIRVSFTLKRH